MPELAALIEILVMTLTEPRNATLFVLLAAAAVIDLRTYRIPNWLSFGGALLGLGYAVVFPFSPLHGIGWALAGMAVGLLMMLPMYALRAMGAGDVKLMAMTGAFLGFGDIAYAVLSTFIVGGLMALGFALYRRVFRQMLANVQTEIYLYLGSLVSGVRAISGASGQSVGRLSYGISIAVGTMSYVIAKALGYL